MFAPEAATAGGRSHRTMEGQGGLGAALEGSGRRFACLLCTIGLLACGGRAQEAPARRGSSLEQRAAAPVAGADAGAARDAGATPEQPLSGPPSLFEDPGCPPASARPSIVECDPFGTPSGCAEGRACFPFVSYPTGPCEVERYGTRCALAGAGVQGDSCDTQRCASNHVCVSSAQGTRCVQLCSFGSAKELSCPGGLVCLPIDIEGFGGCL